MVETTDSFASALKRAYQERMNDATYAASTAEDRKYIGEILQNPIATSRRGRPFYSMRRLHAKVRTMYFWEQGQNWQVAIDWDTLVQWIKDHWLQILQAAAAILSILMLL